MASQLGKRILNLLEKRDMTQRELAQKLGITEVSVSRYINGKHTPHADILNKTAEALNTTIDYLLAGKEFVYTAPEDPSPLTSFVREFSKMDKNEQQKTMQELLSIIINDDKDSKNDKKKK